MFEDRTGNGKYDFSRYDKIARTQTLVEEKQEVQNESEAHKKLFNYAQIKKEEDEKLKSRPLFEHKENHKNTDNLPSSKYLNQFQNQTIDDVEIEVDKAENKAIEPKEIEKSNMDFESLVNTSKEVVGEVKQNQQPESMPAPKKNYSFRIKLVTSVYCILVALFGGWVITNAVNLARTNAEIYETTSSTEQVNQNITDIVSNINNLNNASSNPDDNTALVRIASEEITIIPEETVPPNEYKEQSNWFDAFCNWISGLFGGK